MINWLWRLIDPQTVDEWLEECREYEKQHVEAWAIHLRQVATKAVDDAWERNR